MTRISIFLENIKHLYLSVGIKKCKGRFLLVLHIPDKTMFCLGYYIFNYKLFAFENTRCGSNRCLPYLAHAVIKTSRFLAP